MPRRSSTAPTRPAPAGLLSLPTTSLITILVNNQVMAAHVIFCRVRFYPTCHQMSRGKVAGRNPLSISATASASPSTSAARVEVVEPNWGRLLSIAASRQILLRVPLLNPFPTSAIMRTARRFRVGNKRVISSVTRIDIRMITSPLRTIPRSLRRFADAKYRRRSSRGQRGSNLCTDKA